MLPTPRARRPEAVVTSLRSVTTASMYKRSPDPSVFLILFLHSNVVLVVVQQGYEAAVSRSTQHIIPHIGEQGSLALSPIRSGAYMVSLLGITADFCILC